MGATADPGQRLQRAHACEVVGGGAQPAQALDERGDACDRAAHEQRLDAGQVGQREPCARQASVGGPLDDDADLGRVEELVEHEARHPQAPVAGERVTIAPCMS